MARPVTLFTGQWADLPLETLAKKAASWGYDGVELACWGDHFEVDKALADDGYCKAKRELLKKHGLEVYAISTHLTGQCICDNIDERHKAIVPPDVWGDGKPEGVKKRAAQSVIDAAKAAKKLGIKIVNGFTGSSIWHLLYSFPPASPDMIQAGYDDFAKRFMPILDAFKAEGIKFALEVHPTEIAFDIASAQRAIDAVKGPRMFRLQLRPQSPGLSGRRLRQVHPHLLRSRLPLPHEGRLVGTRRRHRGCVRRPYGIRRSASVLGFPLRSGTATSTSKRSSSPSTILAIRARCRSSGKTAGWIASTGPRRPVARSRSSNFKPSEIAFDGQFDR